MDESIEITQRAMPGAGGQLVGVQNNYHGLTPEEASKLALNLFMDNFPKLQAIAADTAKRRAEELTQGVIERLEKENVRDYSAFTDPDVQYVFWEAQKNYSRMGGENKLEVLSTLLSKRIVNNNEEYYRIVIDRAIETAPFLSQGQLDYLSCLFFFKRAKLESVKSIVQLRDIFAQFSAVFSPCDYNGLSLLQTLGCVELWLKSIPEALSDLYGLNKEEIKKICPPQFLQLSPDNGCSHVGILLGIVNIEKKIGLHADPQIWIHI